MQAVKSCLFLVLIVLASTEGISPVPALGASSSADTGSSPGSPTTASSPSTTRSTAIVGPTTAATTPIFVPTYPTAPKGCCPNGCQEICAVSFRLLESDFYLTTVNNNYLQFQTAALPNPVNTQTQQFILTRNLDCTWSIRSRASGQFISNTNSNGGRWLSMKPYVTQTEKWYLESHQDHIHVQSASAVKSYWVFDSSYGLNIYKGKAVAFKMEFFPCDFQFGWN